MVTFVATLKEGVLEYRDCNKFQNLLNGPLRKGESLGIMTWMDCLRGAWFDFEWFFGEVSVMDIAAEELSEKSFFVVTTLSWLREVVKGFVCDDFLESVSPSLPHPLRFGKSE